MKKIMMLTGFFTSFLYCQETVDVTFRYNAPASPAIYVVGEFNGWNNAASPMTYSGDNLWTRTVSLQVGGNPNPPSAGVPGAWQYKFYYSGASPWPNDPLNHHENPNDNNNTFIITKDPTIYHFLPNQKQGIVKSNVPVISAYLFPKNGAGIDTSTIVLTIDGVLFSGVGSNYDTTTKQLSFQTPVPLANGKHSIILSAGSSAGGTNADTVAITVQAGFVQLTSQGGYSTYNPFKLLRGVVSDTSIHQVGLIRNSLDTTTVSVSNGFFSATDTLSEGVNIFTAFVDTNGTLVFSDPFVITYLVNHNPNALAAVTFNTGSQITVSASASTHPDGKSMTFQWFDDPASPLGLNGMTGVSATISQPTVPGEYYFTLIAKDSIGGADTLRSYFTIKNDGGYENPTYASNPQWAKQARVYFLFPKSFTPQGTIPAAKAKLQYIADMGFNVIWMMPVMKNAYPIDQHYGPGYNIVDFYNVAPEYGTNQDFKDFVADAHAKGIRVILDVTPNHTSRFHPWSQDAHQFKQDSRYWNYYQHTIIAHNDNGLGQSLDADGFNYYSGFSDQLLNYNWKDIDAQKEMINVYKYWIKEFGIDGYRFDVYWGPHRRYGEEYMGMPVRTALKHIKPDILLLAEDDGTGSGTETIYADYTNGNIHGGVDAAYDFKSYFNQIRNFGFSTGGIDNLHSELTNGGYFPGPNALFMRFMESQDEDRITYNYSLSYYYDTLTTLKRTMPMATTIFSVPGFPMIWNGQEIGYGYGISGSKEDRTRTTINWNFPGEFLRNHYQRLAWIRGAFPGFATHAFERISSGNGYVYGMLRKFSDENIVSLANFADVSEGVTLNLSIANGASNMLFSDTQNGKKYYVNDVYNDSTYEITFSNDAAVFSMNLPAYGTAVLVISDSVKHLSVPTITSVHQFESKSIPKNYFLSQNYPNPFNPTTQIQFSIPSSGLVTLKVYDALGRVVSELVNEKKDAGTYLTELNAASLSSGIYFYRLSAGPFIETKKMLLLK